VRWGYYKRFGLPSFKPIRIQRLRCKNCSRTFSLLPSFLLAHRPHSVACLKTVVYLFITSGKDWKKSPDLAVDLSTTYRWLRLLRRQIVTFLPAIRKTLLHLAPATAGLDAKTETLLSDSVLYKRFLDVGEQLYQPAVRLADAPMDSQADIFNFLNFYLAKQTGHPLLML
jgi:transposase-like protein